MKLQFDSTCITCTDPMRWNARKKELEALFSSLQAYRNQVEVIPVQNRIDIVEDLIELMQFYFLEEDSAALEPVLIFCNQALANVQEGSFPLGLYYLHLRLNVFDSFLFEKYNMIDQLRGSLSSTLYYARNCYFSIRNSNLTEKQVIFFMFHCADVLIQALSYKKPCKPAENMEIANCTMDIMKELWEKHNMITDQNILCLLAINYWKLIKELPNNGMEEAKLWCRDCSIELFHYCSKTTNYPIYLAFEEFAKIQTAIDSVLSDVDSEELIEQQQQVTELVDTIDSRTPAHYVLLGTAAVLSFIYSGRQIQDGDTVSAIKLTRTATPLYFEAVDKLFELWENNVTRPFMKNIAAVIFDNYLLILNTITNVSLEIKSFDIAKYYAQAIFQSLEKETRFSPTESVELFVETYACNTMAVVSMEENNLDDYINYCLLAAQFGEMFAKVSCDPENYALCVSNYQKLATYSVLKKNREKAKEYADKGLRLYKLMPQKCRSPKIIRIAEVLQKIQQNPSKLPE